MKKASILIVDDEDDIMEFLTYALNKEGFTTYTANNGKEAIETAKDKRPDLIILDIMMPVMSGLEALKHLREMPAFKNTLIALFTAKGDEVSEIEGLELGADDYINKPIRPKAFLARVNALLRRAKIINTKEVLKFKNINIDISSRKIRIGNESIKLPKMQFNILVMLASKPNEYFARTQIYKEVWGEDVFVGDRTLDVHIRKIREKIGSKRIETSAGIGYAFIP